MRFRTKDRETSTMLFVMDGKTVVEGKLALGEQAVVEYESQDGRNIARHVVVQAAATPHSH